MNETSEIKRREKTIEVLKDRGLGAFADEIVNALIVGGYKPIDKYAERVEFYYGASAMEDIAWTEVKENCPKCWWDFIDVYRYAKHLEEVNEYEWTEHGAVLIL